MKRVLVLGDVCTDVYWQGLISGISAEAPIPVVKCQSLYTLPGMAGNVAHLLQSLGDVQVVLHLPTGAHWAIKNRLMTEDGTQLARWDCEDYCTPYTREDLQTVIDYSAIIVCDYAKGSVTAPVVDRVLEFADSGIPVYVDTKQNPFTWSHPNVTIFPNRVEFNQFKSHYEWMANVVLKQSEHGAFILNYGRVIAESLATSMNPRNVCGAGDSVIAAYTWAQLMGHESPLNFSMEAAGYFVSLPIGVRSLEQVNALPANG